VVNLTHIDLFSGIGGFALAARWAGIKTVQFVEIDKFCQKVLQKNFPGVNIWDDIKTFQWPIANSEHIGCTSSQKERENIGTQQKSKTGKKLRHKQLERIDSLRTDGGGNDDIKTFTYAKSIDNKKQERPIESDRQIITGRETDIRIESRGCSSITQRPFLLTGGFPCQPFSCAGKRRGKEDDRYLWEEMLRVIKEFKPTWIIGENVAGINSMEFQDSVSELEGETDIQENGNGDYTNVLDGICDSLEALNYEVQPIIIPACSVNAPHRRDRVWIVAHSTSDGLSRWVSNCEGGDSKQPSSEGIRERLFNKIKPEDCIIGDTEGQRWCEGNGQEAGDERRQVDESGQERSCLRSNIRTVGKCHDWSTNWLEVATSLCRVDDGVSNRVDRLKSLGNAVVPQIPYLIMKSILEVENV
jgi:DNA (cytosine-5)-methyltransferase 1